jgi:hypothetical protein
MTMDSGPENGILICGLLQGKYDMRGKRKGDTIVEF